MAKVILVIMVIYVTMVYGPIAAFLVELFPTRIRYTSMSLPYHIGNGWFGGMLPLLAIAMVASAGNIYYGLWYPIIVAVMRGDRHHVRQGYLGTDLERRGREIGARSIAPDEPGPRKRAGLVPHGYALIDSLATPG